MSDNPSTTSRKIKPLDVDTIRKIAAGEVIERPVNVVKELVENSIDAEATEIIVELEKGGKALIRVSDDGIGMSAEDLELAWQRHTTSKISGIQDLNRLHTLGFRGEALYSIASVARLRIISRPRDAPLGHELRVEGARQLDLKPVACRMGTTVEVRDLFYNFPVRKKFLRNDSIELAKIHEFLQNFSLGYPEKKFVLKHDRKLLFLSPREKGHKEAILRVHGKRFTQALMEVKETSPHWQLEAYLMLPRTRKNKKKYILTFANGRLVTSDLVEKAVKEGYKEFLVKGDQPVAILFLKASPTEFDINIHPSKKEIAFTNPNEVYELIKKAIERVLHQSLSTLKPLADEAKAPSSLTTFTIAKDGTNSQEAASSTSSDKPMKPLTPQGPSTVTARETKLQSQLPEIASSAFIHVDEQYKDTKTTVSMQGRVIRIIGQLASSYLLLEDVTTNDLIIADQHALDERRRLKLLKTRLEENPLKSEKLLAPLRITPLPEERTRMLQLSKQLKQIGITIRPDSSSPHDLLVDTLPRIITRESLSHEELRDLLLDSCEILEREGHNVKDVTTRLQDHFLRMTACRGAIKFGKTLTHPEIKTLLESLDNLHEPFICAHGRPSVLVLPITKLHALFRRRG